MRLAGIKKEGGLDWTLTFQIEFVFILYLHPLFSFIGIKNVIIRKKAAKHISDIGMEKASLKLLPSI